jgi:glycine amidinotransferase
MTVVNSLNEWDPLREIIVGSARGAGDIGYEPALSPYFPPADAARSLRGQRVPAVLVDEAERQLDHFVTLLDRLGIIVRRPSGQRLSAGDDLLCHNNGSRVADAD